MKFKTWLKRVLVDIFDAAYDFEICNFTAQELADKAGLHINTVYRLHQGLTKEPRMSTIFKLCRAVKMDIGIIKEELAEVSK